MPNLKKDTPTTTNEVDPIFNANDIVEQARQNTDNPSEEVGGFTQIFGEKENAVVADKADDIFTTSHGSIKAEAPVKTILDNSSVATESNDSDDVFTTCHEPIDREILTNTRLDNSKEKIENTIEENDVSKSSPAVVKHDQAKEKTIKSNDNLSFNELLKGAGLNIENQTIEHSAETSFLIGQILHETLQGTMDLLRSRTETKDHLRLGDKTIISIAKNNPLKFLPSANHVITQLILSENNNQAYTPLVDAIQESFDDLKAHQFALSMSIQEALSSTIREYFSPENLQKKLEKSNPISAKIPWQKNAKLWKLFAETYEDIEEEASERFQMVLERKIADAYESNMREIRQRRSVKQPPVR